MQIVKLEIATITCPSGTTIKNVLVFTDATGRKYTAKDSHDFSSWPLEVTLIEESYTITDTEEAE